MWKQSFPSLFWWCQRLKSRIKCQASIKNQRANYPTNKQWTEKSEKKNYGEKKDKRAYIAWDDNDSSEGFEKEEINLLTKIMKAKKMILKKSKTKAKE